METTDLAIIIQQPKIRNVQDTFINKLSRSILKAVFLKGSDINADDADQMARYLEKHIRQDKYLVNLTIAEVDHAIEQGIKGEYGEYFGINNVSLLNFIKAYYYSKERQEMVKAIKYKLLPEKNPPSQEEKRKFIIQGTIQKFETFKETGRLHDFGNPSYNLLARLGIINYTQEKRDEFRQRAKNKLLAEATMLRTTGKTQEERKEAAQIIEDIKNDTLDKRITAEAKKMALRDFFQNLIDANQHISDLINS